MEETPFTLTFMPDQRSEGFERAGRPLRLDKGTLEKCMKGWGRFVSANGFYGVDTDPSRYEAIGLVAKLGTRFSLHIGGHGRLAVSVAPDLTVDPTYEVRPAAERDGWVPAGHTIDDAEIQMRRMGDGPARLLILRNNENGALAVYQANRLGYLDFKGSHDSFYGVRS